MEKLTYSQILEQLKNSGMSVNDFAYEEIPNYLVNGELSEKAKEAQQVKDQWVKDNPNPSYGDDQYKEWYNKTKERHNN